MKNSGYRGSEKSKESCKKCKEKNAKIIAVWDMKDWGRKWAMKKQEMRKWVKKCDPTRVCQIVSWSTSDITSVRTTCDALHQRQSFEPPRLLRLRQEIWYGKPSPSTHARLPQTAWCLQNSELSRRGYSTNWWRLYRPLRGRSAQPLSWVNCCLSINVTPHPCAALCMRQHLIRSGSTVKTVKRSCAALPPSKGLRVVNSSGSLASGPARSSREWCESITSVSWIAQVCAACCKFGLPPATMEAICPTGPVSDTSEAQSSWRNSQNGDGPCDVMLVGRCAEQPSSTQPQPFNPVPDSDGSTRELSGFCGGSIQHEQPCWLEVKDCWDPPQQLLVLFRLAPDGRLQNFQCWRFADQILSKPVLDGPSSLVRFAP